MGTNEKTEGVTELEKVLQKLAEEAMLSSDALETLAKARREHEGRDQILARLEGSDA